MRYSFTKLTSFYDCPHAFYQNYQLGEKGEGNPFSDYGVLVHSILERYANGKLQLEELPEEFEAGFEISMISPILMFGKDHTQSYFEKGLTFFKNFTGFWNLKPVEAEYRFETALGKDSFIGIIDLIATNSDGDIVIVDHKSSSKFSKKDLVHKQRQLYLYAKAILDRYGKFPKELWFNHFKDNYLEKITFNEDDYYEAITWAMDTIEKIEGEIEFKPNTSSKFFCSHLCDYRNICEYN